MAAHLFLFPCTWIYARSQRKERKILSIIRQVDRPRLMVCKSYSVTAGRTWPWSPYLRGFLQNSFSVNSQSPYQECWTLALSILRNCGPTPPPPPHAALSPCSHTRHQPLPLLWRSDVVEPECERRSAYARITGYTKLQQLRVAVQHTVASWDVFIWGPKRQSSKCLHLRRNNFHEQNVKWDCLHHMILLNRLSSLSILNSDEALYFSAGSHAPCFSLLI